MIYKVVLNFSFVGLILEIIILKSKFYIEYFVNLKIAFSDLFNIKIIYLYLFSMKMDN